MAISWDEFESRVTTNELLRAEDLATIRSEISCNADAAVVAEHLVEKGLLTRYQATVLLQPTTEPLALGDYVILDFIGQGGMGKVFKAEHRKMERVVALKMLPVEDVHDAEAVGRFEREIKAAARLVHPNIVTAYDARTENEMRYLVCEFIDGIDLSSLIKRDGPLDVRTAIDCVLQAARGLDHSHKQKIIHRDIKPSNLMLAKSGQVKVLDLGLSQFASLFSSGDVVSTVSELTGSGHVVGTIDYMAPEQAIDCRGVDIRADVYSLGCTLYYLLAGRPPFSKGSTIERLMAHQQQDFPRLCHVRKQIPEQLDDVLRRMVARDPNDRIPDMTEVIRLLENVDRELSAIENDEPLPEAQRDTSQFNSITANLEVDVRKPLPAETDDRSAGNRQEISEHTPPRADDPSGDTPPGKSPSLQNRWRLVVPVALAGIVLSGLLVFLISQVVYKSDLPAEQTPESLAALERDVATNGTHTNGDKANAVRPAAMAPVTVETPSESQASWAQRLGVPLREIPFSNLSLVLIPPGELQLDEHTAKTTDQKSLVFASTELSPRTGSLKVAAPFYCSTHEVTRQQFLDLLGFDPSMSQGLDDSKDSMSRPVETVTWQETVRFCNALSETCGMIPYYEIQGNKITAAGGTGFRLPSEDEWEYACRAGTTSKFPFGNKFDDLHDYGWFASNAKSRTHPVGSKQPNPFGLYDMHGNVWEWCDDLVVFKPNVNVRRNRRMVRGGSWMHDADECGSASRTHYGVIDKGPNGGFRVARTVALAGKTGTQLNE